MKKILISGGAGFIGSRLVESLWSRGYQVTVLDNLSPQVHGDDPSQSPLLASIQGKAFLMRGDVTSSRDWESALQGQDAVVHLAAETGTGQSMYRIDRYTRTNVLGTALLADHLANKPHTIRKVVVASSRAVYGEGKYHCPEHGNVFPPQRESVDMHAGNFEPRCPVCRGPVVPLATDEDSIQNPNSLYAVTKQAQEQILMNVCRSLSIPVVAFRYQNVYGPGQALCNPYTGILSIFSTRIRNGNSIEIFEDGRESRDFVYIDDAVRATVLGLESRAADYRALNVGTGRPVEILAAAQALCKQYGTHSDIEITGRFRAGDIRHNFADVTRIGRLLGFVPEYDFQRGISAFCEWVHGQPPVTDTYDRSISELNRRGFYK